MRMAIYFLAITMAFSGCAGTENKTESEIKTDSENKPDSEVKIKRKAERIHAAAFTVDHIVDLIGIDHVGIGTDFDGGGGLEDCYDVSEMGNITLELVRRGYSAREIKKIWSGNLTRVLKEVERAAI